MKLTKTLGAVAAALALSAVSSQAVLSFDFTGLEAIQFNGSASSFQLNPLVASIPANPQFKIINETGGSGAVGLFGYVNGGPFTYGPITTSPDGHTQSAMVVGPTGSLAIYDGVSAYLTGNISWGEIQTYDAAGAINATLAINVTGLSYSGSNSDLAAMAAGLYGALNLTFQFSPGKTLTQLTTGSDPFRTSYSGSLSSVPEPTTVVAASLLLLPFGASTLRIIRRNRAAAAA